ncbi:unnamed protein product [Soboliphyme baturini]|uniref:PDZ domain-containing protein n=1 Tax=Soboliphyme baturini TaxID=241478 RepID=A0A183IX71_9BILA|nr:unnamed protein product [Soboliphyme baturini]
MEANVPTIKVVEKGAMVARLGKCTDGRRCAAAIAVCLTTRQDDGGGDGRYDDTVTAGKQGGTDEQHDRAKANSLRHVRTPARRRGSGIGIGIGGGGGGGSGDVDDDDKIEIEMSLLVEQSPPRGEAIQVGAVLISL